MKLNDFTSIGRPIDPAYPTNRWLLIILLAVFFLGLALQKLLGTSTQAACLWALRADLVLFFSWALCRELDPDDELAAFLALVLAAPMLAWVAPGTGHLFWLLCTVRLVNRTTGLAPTWIDSAIVLALAWATHSGVLLLLTSLSFGLDSTLRGGQRRQILFSVVALTLAALTRWPAVSHLAEGAGALLIAGAFQLTFARVVPTACGDCDSNPVDAMRVRSATGVALIAGIAIVLTEPQGVPETVPLWAAALASILYRARMYLGTGRNL